MTQEELAELLSSELGKKYARTRVNNWENGAVAVPGRVGEYVLRAQLAEVAPRKKRAGGA